MHAPRHESEPVISVRNKSCTGQILEISRPLCQGFNELHEHGVLNARDKLSSTYYATRQAKELTSEMNKLVVSKQD